MFDNFKLKPGFIRNIFVVMSGTVAAQAIAFAMMPVISRLYTPEDFGTWGSFMAIVAIFSSGATFQYSQALMLPKKESEAFNLLVLACLCTFGVVCLAVIVCFQFPSWVTGFINYPLKNSILKLIPVAVFFLGLNTALRAWCVRNKAFKRTSAAQIVRSVTVISGQTSAGFLGMGAPGLVLGTILGDFMANLTLSRILVGQTWRELKSSISLKVMFSLAKVHKAFALYTNTQSVMNAVAQGIPVLLIARYYGVPIAGLYAFAVKILQVPMNLILASLRPVLFQKICEVSNAGGDIHQIFVKTTRGLCLIAIGPVILGVLFAPVVFSFVFGLEWIVAGQFVQFLILGQAVSFCNVPANLMGQVIGQQRPFMFIHLFYVLANVLVLVICGQNFSVMTAIAFLSIVSAVTSGMLILRIYYCLQKGNYRISEQVNVD